MSWLKEVIGTEKAIIAMCHMQAMPGDVPQTARAAPSRSERTAMSAPGNAACRQASNGAVVEGRQPAP